jgi:hypothetical protein
MRLTDNWTREMRRYRIIEHTLRGESVYVVEWNDRWFLGIWGIWHEKFHSTSLEDAIQKIQRLVHIKINK